MAVSVSTLTEIETSFAAEERLEGRRNMSRLSVETTLSFGATARFYMFHIAIDLFSILSLSLFLTLARPVTCCGIRKQENLAGQTVWLSV